MILLRTHRRSVRSNIGMEIGSRSNRNHYLGSGQSTIIDFIGTSGDIPLTVRYPDSISDLQVLIPVNTWLRNEDNPSPTRELGINPVFDFEALVLGPVLETGSGYSGGLREGDILLSVNGIDIDSAEWFIEQVSSSINQPLMIDLERPDQQEKGSNFLSLEVIPQSVLKNGEFVGQLGVQLAVKGKYPDYLIREIDHNVLSASSRAVEETVTTAGFILSSLGKLLAGDLSAKNLSGPITIAKMAGDTGRAGIDNFIRFIAILYNARRYEFTANTCVRWGAFDLLFSGMGERLSCF